MTSIVIKLCNINKGALKMREWKMQEWKMREQIAGVENAGVENEQLYSPKNGRVTI